VVKTDQETLNERLQPFYSESKRALRPKACDLLDPLFKSPLDRRKDFSLEETRKKSIILI